MDITGAEGYPMSHNPEVEGEAAKCAIRIPQTLDVAIYLAHVSTKEAFESISRKRSKCQRVF